MRLLLSAFFLLSSTWALAQEPRTPEQRKSRYLEHDRQQGIPKALTSPAELIYRKTPLDVVVKDIADRFDIPIEFDSEALSAAGVDPKLTPVTIDLANVSLKSALRLMLRDLRLVYSVHNDVLLITSEEALPENLEILALKMRVFELQRHVRSLLHKQHRLREENTQLKRMLELTDPDSVSERYDTRDNDEIIDMLRTLSYANFYIEYVTDKYKIREGDRWRMPKMGKPIRPVKLYRQARQHLGHEMEVILPLELGDRSQRQLERFEKEIDRLEGETRGQIDTLSEGDKELLKNRFFQMMRQEGRRAKLFGELLRQTSRGATSK